MKGCGSTPPGVYLETPVGFGTAWAGGWYWTWDEIYSEEWDWPPHYYQQSGDGDSTGRWLLTAERSATVVMGVLGVALFIAGFVWTPPVWSGHPRPRWLSTNHEESEPHPQSARQRRTLLLRRARQARRRERPANECLGLHLRRLQPQGLLHRRHRDRLLPLRRGVFPRDRRDCYERTYVFSTSWSEIGQL